MNDENMLLEVIDIVRSLKENSKDESIKDLYDIVTMLLNYIRESN